MKKPKLIAPHYFYWFHLLFIVGFFVYFFLLKETHLSITVTSVIIITIYSIGTNYYSIFGSMHKDDFVEINPLTIISIIIVFHFYAEGQIFALGIFLLIDGLMVRQVYRKEFQKIYLNVTFCFSIGFTYYLTFVLLSVDVSDPLIINFYKSLVILAIFSFLEIFLTFGFFSQELNQPLNLSIQDGIKLYLDLFLSAMLAVPIYLLVENYSQILALTLVTFSILWAQVIKSDIELYNAQKSSLELLTRTLEEKDPYTAGHSKRVQKYSIYTGAKMRLAPWRISRLRDAALLHDIGKLVVPSSILNKPGKLTEEEFEKMKEHEEVTSKLIRMITFLRPVALFTSPEELHPFEDNPKELIEPHIIYACDAYDAMTSSRSYRKALSQEVAFKELRDNAGEGKQFKSEVVEALISYIESTKQKHGLGYEQENFHEDAPTAGTGSAGLGDLIDEDGKPTKVSKGEPSQEIAEKATTEENEEVNHDS
jgi:hypothetical protein